MKNRMILALAMICLLLIPVSMVQADERSSGPWTYELESGGLVITGYTGNEADVVIPDEIDGYLVTVIGKQAFMDNHTMKSLVIPESIVSIRSEAFLGCLGLSRICFNAVNCTVAGVDTYEKNKGRGVFSGAGSASSDGLYVIFGDKVAIVPDNLFDTASIDRDYHRGSAFAYVTQVEIPDSVKEIGACAFRGCQNLESVSFGSAIQSIGNEAFLGCLSLDNLVFNDALATIGEKAFYGSKALKNITWGTSLDSIGNSAFRNCESLAALVLVNPLSTIGANAFSDCIALESLTLPESLKNIKSEAFTGCIKLNRILFNCTNCTAAAVDTYEKNKGIGVFSGAGSASSNGLEVILGNTVAKVPDNLFDTASIDRDYHRGSAFAYVTQVEISDSVKEIGACAFRGCQNLESVSFGSAIQSIGTEAFWGCLSLDNLVFNDALATIGEKAFYGSKALNSITWGTSLDSIGNSAFRNCESLETLVLVNPLSTIGANAFSDCITLESLTLPESLKNIKSEAFTGCIKLNLIHFNCTNCTAAAVDTYENNKGIGVFSGAGSASSDGLEVIFGNTVAKVPDNLFDTASIDKDYHRGHPFAYITQVVIPDSVKEIGSCAFRGCQNLEVVRFAGSNVIFGEHIFDNCILPGFRIECLPGSEVEIYAMENGFSCAALNPADLENSVSGTDGTWTCENGHEGNTGLFCPECGAAKPVEDSETWTCINGHEGNTGNFCPECGAARP